MFYGNFNNATFIVGRITKCKISTVCLSGTYRRAVTRSVLWRWCDFILYWKKERKDVKSCQCCLFMPYNCSKNLLTLSKLVISSTEACTGVRMGLSSVQMGPERTGTPFRSFFGRPQRRSSPFKTTRLVVKIHQAYVLASEGLSR